MNTRRFTGPTRNQRRSLIPSRVRSLTGDPIPCPVDYCGTLVYPSFANNGEVEYRCIVGGHGQIGVVVNGRIELRVRTLVGPRHRILPQRVKCAYPGCTNQRNKECGRDYCQGHCLEKDTTCGGYQHDYARMREVLRAQDAVRARESLEVHPGTPLFLPSLSPEPRSSPVPGIDFDVNAACVQLEFTDRDFAAEAVCTVAFGLVDLQAQSLRVREILHVHQVKPATLEYRDSNGQWYRTAGRAIPVHHAQLHLRARSVGHMRNFPPAYYVDMAPRVRRFFKLVDQDVARDEAFQDAFDCEPNAGDHESLKLCREVLEKSPRHLRDRFDTAGRTPRGTWSEFLHTYYDAIGARNASSPSDRDSSPLLRSSRPSWRGPPASQAGSSRPSQQSSSPLAFSTDSDSE